MQIHNCIKRESCPFCKSNLFLIQENGNFTCFSCFKTGDAGDLSAELNNKFPQLTRSVSINDTACRYFQKKLFRCSSYLKERKISEKTCQQFRLGYADGYLTAYLVKCGYSYDELIAAGLTVERNGEYFDVFYKRLIFPIINNHGVVVGFGGRKIDNNSPAPKYINSKQTEWFNKKTILFGTNTIKNFNNIILVEGYMDVVSLCQAGVGNAVAALGTAVGKKHCQLLKSLGTEKVTICLDSDGPGTNAALKAISVLKDAFEVEVLQVPDGKDPDEYIKRNSLKAFNSLPTIGWKEFLLKHKELNLDLLLEIT